VNWIVVGLVVYVAGRRNTLDLAGMYSRFSGKSITFLPPGELSKRPHDTQQQIRHGRILTGEGQVSFAKTIWTHPAPSDQHYSPQVIKVAGQPVHRMAKHCVAFADEALHGLQVASYPCRRLCQ
jgi:hypothetical protein